VGAAEARTAAGAGKAKPMIVGMENGGIADVFRKRDVASLVRQASTTQAATRPADGPRMRTELTRILLDETIPMVDATCRTLADREHRAMAGLSTGAMQTFITALPNLDEFAYVGGFSSALGPASDVQSAYGGALADADALNRKVKVLYISVGSAEGEMYDEVNHFHKGLENAGMRHVYYESPGTAHEWQTWRRSLHGFAPRLFRD
jgi:enterochelin esterase family protein